MQTSTMMEAEIASTSHPVNDANTQTITKYLNSSRLFSLIHVHSCDVHAMALVISSKSPWPEHGAKVPRYGVRMAGPSLQERSSNLKHSRMSWQQSHD